MADVNRQEDVSGEMPACVEAAHLSQHSGAPQVGLDLQNDPTLQGSAARTLSMLLLAYSLHDGITIKGMGR